MVKEGRSVGFPTQGGGKLFRSICKTAICTHQIYLLALAVQRGLCAASCRETQNRDRRPCLRDVRSGKTLPGTSAMDASNGISRFNADGRLQIQLTIERIFVLKRKTKASVQCSTAPK